MNLVRAGQSNILSCFVFHHTSKRSEPGRHGDPAAPSVSELSLKKWFLQWTLSELYLMLTWAVTQYYFTHQIRQQLRVCAEHPRSSNKITCGYKVWNCLDWVSQCLNRVSGPERMGGEEETAAWLLSHRLSVSTRLNSVKHCDIFRWGESLQRVEI